MKLLICSDIHGDFNSAKKIIDTFHEEGCDKILILGDILYHGPRNDLPCGYAPKKVIELLNENKDKLLCVRGNCDTEVDQMVLDFPILADYAFLELDGLRILATHGHKYNTSSLPPLMDGDILLHGHTHVIAFEDFGKNNCYINPGSVSIPKGGNPRSFIIYSERTFECRDFEKNTISSRKF